jgi:hypothetical protein
MTTNMKDRWITISLAVTCAFGSVLLGNFLVNRKAQANNYESRIKSVEMNKADRAELVDFKAENLRMHESEKKDMKDYFDTRFEDLKSFMIELNKRK